MGSPKAQTLSWAGLSIQVLSGFSGLKGVFFSLLVNLSIFLLLLLMSWLRFFTAGLGKFYEGWVTS